MSKLMNKPIEAKGVNIVINDGLFQCTSGVNTMTVKFHNSITINYINDEINIVAGEDILNNSKLRPLLGTTIALIKNAIKGVKEGFQKTVILEGTGYKAVKTDDKLVFNVGKSHPVEKRIPEYVDVTLDTTKKLIIKSKDKQLLGQFVAELRKMRAYNVYTQSGVIDPENPKDNRKKEVKKK